MDSVHARLAITNTWLFLLCHSFVFIYPNKLRAYWIWIYIQLSYRARTTHQKWGVNWLHILASLWANWISIVTISIIDIVRETFHRSFNVQRCCNIIFKIHFEFTRSRICACFFLNPTRSACRGIRSRESVYLTPIWSSLSQVGCIIVYLILRRRQSRATSPPMMWRKHLRKV